MKKLSIVLLCFTIWTSSLLAQNTLKGKVNSYNDNDPLIGATVIIKGTTEGANTDFDGIFELKTSHALPFTLVVSYLGYDSKEIEISNFKDVQTIKLPESAVLISNIEITGQRISEKQKESPLTIESMDLLAIKATPSDNFYDGLGSMKGIDLTAASLGFKIINMRGFNSTSPVRSLQIIDGVDNQAPGLNFSLGNFLGSSELDVNKVDLIVGASSAFYGPNAFNGVISMETKNPFYSKGLSASLKFGERSLFETSVRYADAVKNKNGKEFLGYKFNFSYLRANDWKAENYNPIDGSPDDKTNPGGFDAVNKYGDESYSLNNATSIVDYWGLSSGLRRWYRTPYAESDLVDYDTKNFKSNLALHFRTQPNKEAASPEFIVSSSFGSGTTVYQGDNRFRLKNILFFQNRLEYRLKDKFFIRAYATNEDAGNSYDPYFTALILQNKAKSDELWSNDYSTYWKTQGFSKRMIKMGYPELKYNPQTGQFDPFDFAGADAWLLNHRDSLTTWHQQAENFANGKGSNSDPLISPFYQPGTSRYDSLFNIITTTKSNKKGVGSQFYDKSALYHVHAEYKFEPKFTDYIVVGGNGRYYRPKSDGTIFYDTSGVSISNYEYGIYSGIQKKFAQGKLISNLALRMDKNQNFDYIFTPAASLVYTPSENNYFRLSFSSAVRNPTLTDQYLYLNVGRAILSGNLKGVDSLVTVESFVNYLNSQLYKDLRFFKIDPIKPERVKTFELGYRTTLFNKVYLDAGYYYSIYDDFIGYKIGVFAKWKLNDPLSLPRDVQAYRYSANSNNQVRTQGVAIGLNYYFGKFYMLNGNYSWNRLVKTVEDDPIIPAFNTPEHKFNLGFTSRDMYINIGKTRINNVGFAVNYKWVKGFTFEGSPQFTGYIPDYGLVDVQVNYTAKNLNTTFKLGASNLLNELHYETYGGPLIGRMGYLSIIYDFKK